MPRFLPLIMKAAACAADFARNWRLVYCGALGDNRSIVGNDGQYSVRVQPPLRIADTGIVLDFTDERWRLLSPLAPATLPAGGDEGQPLCKKSNANHDVEWREGPTQTITLLADVRYDTASAQLQMKTIQLQITQGLVTSVGEASGWAMISGGQAQECP